MAGLRNWATGLVPSHDVIPGLLIAGLIAMASQFVSDHYGAPSMLLALLFGIALNFLSDEDKPKAGIQFGSKQLLRLGVALLGVRISADVILGLGWQTVLLVVLGIVVTIAAGLLMARALGFGFRFGFLSAGSVAICGASAAIAISAILPKNEKSDERLVFAIVGVTILSTVAMIVYPVLGGALGLDHHTKGILIGATIHDVAQVVGAGYSVSEQTGDLATLVKLLRVLCLAPVVLFGAIAIRMLAKEQGGAANSAGLIPGFVVAFLLLATARSFGLLPEFLISAASEASRWMLLTAIAAVGLKTVPKDIINVGLPAISLIVAETLFLLVFVLIALQWVI